MIGTVHVLEAARAVDGLQAVVSVTTDKCYENREWLWPYREDEPLGGRDPYSSSKACAELVTAAYRRSFFDAAGVRVATARAGNVIGGGDWAADRLVPDLLRAADAGVSTPIRVTPTPSAPGSTSSSRSPATSSSPKPWSSAATTCRPNGTSAPSRTMCARCAGSPSG